MTEEAKALIERARALLARLGWKYPFFLLPASKALLRVTENLTLTCAAEARGIVFLNPAYCKTLEDNQFRFVLAHELMHLMMLHFGRQGSRKRARWNRATDRALNQMLKTLDTLDPPPGVLFPLASEHEEYTAEELYEVEPEQTGDDAVIWISVQPGAGCGVLDAPGGDSGDGGGDNESQGEDPENGTYPTIVEAGREWRRIAAQAQAQARSAGSETGAALAQLLELPPSRVRWSQLLRGSCARARHAHGYDDVSFTRRNRRSFAGDFILPGGVTYRAAVAVVVDTSGSISDRDLEQALSEIVAISAFTQVGIYLVTHDAGIQWQGWIHAHAKQSAIAATFTGRGGTTFTEAYDAVQNVGQRFDHMIHLTDGCPFDSWPDKPLNVRRLVVALLGCASQHAIPEGTTVVETEI